MKIASWNIAGGRTFRGANSDALAADYDKEQLGYFVQTLRAAHPQLVALQEVHKPSDASRPAQSDTMGQELAMEVTVAQPYGDSHIEKGQQLSLANLSEFPIRNTSFHLLPNPNLTVNRPDGQIWRTLDVGFLVSEVEYNQEVVQIANGHMVPLHYFGRNYVEPDFKPILEDLTNFFELLADKPTIIAGDFNYPDLTTILPDIFKKDLYQEAFAEATTPSKGQQDHVLLSHHWKLNNAGTKKVDADHFLCLAEVELK